MAAMNQGTGRADRGTVIGLFRDRGSAEHAIRQLREAGFSEKEISIAMRDRDQQAEMSESTGAPVAKGAATGAVSGGVVGGLIGLLGSLLIPGVGPIVVAGELASALTGAAAGAATGGIVGALVGLGATEDEAKHFDEGFRAGGVLVTVNAGARAAEARQLLLAAGADLGPMHGADAREAGIGGAGAATAGISGRGDIADRDLRDEEQRMLLREEELDVQKRTVDAGEVRLRKEVVTEERSIDVPVTREEVVVERRPVTGENLDAGEIREGEEIRIPVREEEVRVEKRPVAKEEIRAGKRKVEGTERLTGTVAHEEAHVESVGDTHLRAEGDLVGAGAEAGAAPGTWRGKERRVHRDRNYNGPERRRATLR